MILIVGNFSAKTNFPLYDSGSMKIKKENTDTIGQALLL